MRSILASKIATKTRDEWTKIFDALPDACVVPVLELEEAPEHPQNLARKSFVRNKKGKFEPVSTAYSGNQLVSHFKVYLFVMGINFNEIVMPGSAQADGREPKTGLG